MNDTPRDPITGDPMTPQNPPDTDRSEKGMGLMNTWWAELERVHGVVGTNHDAQLDAAYDNLLGYITRLEHQTGEGEERGEDWREYTCSSLQCAAWECKNPNHTIIAWRLPPGVGKQKVIKVLNEVEDFLRDFHMIVDAEEWRDDLRPKVTRLRESVKRLATEWDLTGEVAGPGVKKRVYRDCATRLRELLEEDDDA